MKGFFSFLFLFLHLVIQAQTGQEWFEKGLYEKDELRKIEYFTRALSLGKNDNSTFYYRAYAYLEVDQFDLAYKDLYAAIAAKTGEMDSSTLFSGLAWAYYKGKEEEKALKFADRALRSNAENSGAWSIKGWVNVGLKNYPEAEKCFTEFIRLKPAEQNGYHDRCWLRLQNKNYEGALGDAEKGLKIDPKNASLQQWKSLSLLKLGREEEAVGLMKDKVSYKPDDPLSLMNIGVLFQNNGDYEGAIAFHSQAILLYDKKVREDGRFVKVFLDDIYSIYIARGNCYEMLRNYTQALRDYTRAATYNPAGFDAWFLTGEIQTQQSNWLEAVNAYERAYDIKPAHTAGWVNLGYCYGKLNQVVKSIDAYTRGLKADPTNGLLWNNRGYTYLELKKYDLAKADFEKAIEVEPNIQMSHVSLAEFFYYTGDFPKAISQFSAALEVPEQDSDARLAAFFTRGLCKRELKDYEGAISDFDEATLIDAHFSRAWEQKAICLYHLNKKCEAYKTLKKALELDSKNQPRECKEASLYLGKLTQNPCG